MNNLDALFDWLGDGGEPVHEMVANRRATICASGNEGKPCPHNNHPHWWEGAKHIVAEWIRHELQLKHDMKLTVQNENEIQMCSACGCCLRLKVWTPIKHIKNHTDPSKLPQFCWIKKEMEYAKL